MIINIAGYDQEVYTIDDINQARAEALKDAADRAEEHIRQWQGSYCLREAILAGEVKE